MAVAGSKAARLADQWGAPEPSAHANGDAKNPFHSTPKWNPLPQRDAAGKHGGGGSHDDDDTVDGKAAGGGCGEALNPEPKPPSPLDAFKLPAELEAGSSFGGLPVSGSDGLSAAAVGGFADAAGQPFGL